MGCTTTISQWAVLFLKWPAMSTTSAQWTNPTTVFILLLSSVDALEGPFMSQFPNLEVKVNPVTMGSNPIWRDNLLLTNMDFHKWIFWKFYARDGLEQKTSFLKFIKKNLLFMLCIIDKNFVNDFQRQRLLFQTISIKLKKYLVKYIEIGITISDISWTHCICSVRQMSKVKVVGNKNKNYYSDLLLLY